MALESLSSRRLAQRARRVARAVRRFLDRPARLAPLVHRMVNAVATTVVREHRVSHVVLASTGNRNIGDQAMLESYIANVEGHIDVIATSRSTYQIPDSANTRVRLHILDGLANGRRRSRARDLATFQALISEAMSFSVIGADLMDAGYQLRGPSLSWALATGAALAGIDTRVLGFSWGERVPETIVAAARRASAAGVQLFARDPDSAARLTQDGVTGVTEVVDIVFTLPGVDVDTPEWEHLHRAYEAGQEIGYLNISGLIAARIDLRDDYVKVVNAMRDLGLRVVLVPHVDNAGGSDIAAGREFAAYCARQGSPVDTIDRLLAPRQVRAIAGLGKVVVTGRMHLGILAISAGTPAMVLSTQGKVSGLLGRIGHPEWCLEPVHGFSDSVTRQLSTILEGSAATDLKARLPDLRLAAGLNFSGLDAGAR